jgi:hypothetical protein
MMFLILEGCAEMVSLLLCLEFASLLFSSEILDFLAMLVTLELEVINHPLSSVVRE